MKKALGLKDKILCLYADYSLCSVIHEESSWTLQNILDLSDELNINIDFGKN